MEKFRFIQFSDLFLDGDFSDLEGFAPDLRRYLLEVFEKIINLAINKGADALLIGGNLFNEKTVQDNTVQFLRKRFQNLSPIKVFISPGAADPYHPGSPYEKEEWPSNVVIFNRDKFTAHTMEDYNITIHGLANTGSLFKARRLSGLLPEDDQRRHILLLNGLMSGLEPETMESPALFTQEDLLNSGMNYAALGGISRHRFIMKPGNDQLLAAYSGKPQGTRFSDNGDMGILSVEMAGGKSNVKFIQTARTRFVTQDLVCTNFNDIEEVKEGIRSIIREKNLESSPTLINLKGKVNENIKEIDTEDLSANTCAECIYLRVVDGTFTDYDLDTLKGESTARGFFTRAILEKMEDPSAKDREELEVLNLALKYGLDSFSREGVYKRWK